VGTASQKDLLISIYEGGAKITVHDKSLTKVAQVFDTLRKATIQKGVPENALPNLRDQISKQINEWIPKLTTATPLNDTMRATLDEKFTIIAGHLSKLP